MVLLEEMECVGFLRNIREPYLNEIATMARLKECAEGEILFRECEKSPYFYFLLSGEISLEIEHATGDPIDIYTAGPGELLGWSPVLGRPAMSATARASTRCRLAVLEVSRVLALCEQDPSFGMAFLKQVGRFLSDRLNSTHRCLAFARIQRPTPFALSHEGSD